MARKADPKALTLIENTLYPDLHRTGDEFVLPVLRLGESVLIPGNNLPYFDCDHYSETELRRLQKRGQSFAVVSQIQVETGKQLVWAAVATEATLVSLLRLPDGKLGLVLKGSRRIAVLAITKVGERFQATVQHLEDRPFKITDRFMATVRALQATATRALRAHPGVAEELRATLENTDDPQVICDLVVPHLTVTAREKLDYLGIGSVRERMRCVQRWLARERELTKLTSEISDQVTEDLHDTHRRFFLREQIRAIKQELGEMEGTSQDSDALAEEFAALVLPEAVRAHVDEELERLSAMSPGSSEYMVAHSHLLLIKDLPWSTRVPQMPSLRKASDVLHKAHFGLEKVKERIIEHLAVMRHSKSTRGQILLLVGPPGVGKTSLAQSIAACLNRPFVRIALGGVRDEAEIRGHRRTYIGAMPGKIIQGVKQAKSRAPVMLLDEIDKVGSDKRGDVSSAMLEVLDPEQNKFFTDHYLGLPFDLSQVVFIATANDIEAIPTPLLDRMEVVELSSYTEQEKIEIAKRHLVPNLRRDLNLSAKQFRLNEATLRAIINAYTREAGVRQLKQELTRVGRKLVKIVIERVKGQILAIDEQTLEHWLGVPKFLDEPRDRALPAGVAVGLAFTDFGGEIMYIESSVVHLGAGKGRMLLTGSLGKVMQESVQAVTTYILANAVDLHLAAEYIEDSKIHVHFPDGATPKDGPSAGIAVLCAIVSGLKRMPLPSDLAMTGEITLRGQVLPVGGIKEKVLAAHRYGKRRIILPYGNLRDLADVPLTVLREVEIFPVQSMREVLRLAGLVAPDRPDDFSLAYGYVTPPSDSSTRTVRQ